MELKVYYCYHGNSNYSGYYLEDYVFDVGICVVQIDAYTGRVCATFDNIEQYMRIIHHGAAIVRIF